MTIDRHVAPGPIVSQLASLESGRELMAWINRGPLLLVFPRHGACVFCKVILSRLAEQQSRIAELGVRPVVIHMMEPQRAARMMQHYGLQPVSALADPQRALYEAFGLRRGRLLEVMGPHIWWPALRAMFRGHLPGFPREDIRQLPGAVVAINDRPWTRFRAGSSADIPDFVELCQAAIGQAADRENS